MTNEPVPMSAAAWAAFEARDRAFDGRFVVGVVTTGIYCRPSCPARRPKRANARLLADAAAAEALGLRACLRCRPNDVARDRLAVQTALALISARAGPPTLAELGIATGYSPAHLQRLFTRDLGVSPAAFAREKRVERERAALNEEATITDAIGAAGHGSASGFYARADDRLGMTPSAWRAGGKCVLIRWTVVSTSMGELLIAATERGLCRVAFGLGEAELRAQFPAAELVHDAAALAALAKAVVTAVERPGRPHDLPLDVAGTAFQQAVWRELARVPPGETVSYAALAVRAGKPGAARAAGTACGANPIAVLVPCHRAVRADGALGGYAWGLDRKTELLARERDQTKL